MHAFTHDATPDELERVEHKLNMLHHGKPKRDNTFSLVGDSGCTHDAFNEPEHFHSIEELKTPIRMGVGCKGKCTSATHMGDVPVVAVMSNGDDRKHAFKNAFFSRDCSGCFPSNSMRDRMGWTVVSKNNEMHCHDENGNEKFHAVMKNGLHHVNCRSAAVSNGIHALRNLNGTRNKLHCGSATRSMRSRSPSPEPIKTTRKCGGLGVGTDRSTSMRGRKKSRSVHAAKTNPKTHTVTKRLVVTKPTTVVDGILTKN